MQLAAIFSLLINWQIQIHVVHVTVIDCYPEEHCRAEVSIGAEKTILKCRTSAGVVLLVVIGSGAVRMDESVAGIL